MSVRVRFAPSPTGYLHIGGARTALFNWLYARHHGGTFILRIEDTDEARNSKEAVDVILEGLKWLGLDWDEGPLTSDPKASGKGSYEPYFQSQRSYIYQRRVEQLLNSGHAYRKDGAIRFRMPRAPITMDDLVVGKVTRHLTDREELDPDFVIVRSDGQPVFHLVNVVDDLEMGITHVIRGEDHLSNTPKHIALFQAFSVVPPRYAHIPLILNSNGSKMSKRDEGASLTSYLTEGYLPEAVVNYLCLLGWSPKNDNEVLDVSEVVQRFDLPQILRHNARFDLKKLLWLNWEYIRKMPAENYLRSAKEIFLKSGLQSFSNLTEDRVNDALLTCKEKIQKFDELPKLAGFYFADQVQIDDATLQSDFSSDVINRLVGMRVRFEKMNSFCAEDLQGGLKSYSKELELKMAALVHPLRIALTGSSSGPSLYHLMEILGQAEVLKRLDSVILKSKNVS